MSNGLKAYETFVGERTLDSSLGGSEKILLSDSAVTKNTTTASLKTYVNTSPAITNPTITGTITVPTNSFDMTRLYGLPFVTVGSASSGANYLTDGTADNVQLQSAIDAMNLAGGGVVYVLDSSYDIASPVNHKSKVYLRALNKGGVTFTGSSAFTGSKGLISITNQNDLGIFDITFNVSGTARAITTFGHDGLIIQDCRFTGTTSTTDGLFHFEGNLGSAPMRNTFFIRNKFYDATSIQRSVHMYARNGNIIENTYFEDNHFENVYGPCIFLDCYDYIRNTVVTNNKFIDILGIQTANLAACALHTRISASGAYFIEDTMIDRNFYSNSTTRSDLAGQSQGFVYFYECKRTTITNNRCIGAFTADPTVTGPCIATGRTAYPDIGVVISNNHIESFDAAWDHDATRFVEVDSNIVKYCGSGWILGYGVQEYINIHDNIEYNSRYTSPYYGFIQLGNANHVKCSIRNNQYIDDTAVPGTAYAVNCTGHAYDHTDVVIEGNRFLIVNGTFTAITHKEYSDSTLPKLFENNELEDTSGTTNLYLNTLGNKSGALTIDAAEGTYTTLTLTNNITLTLSAGVYIGQKQTIVTTQDATGGRTMSKPANARYAGGSYTLTTTAGAKDKIILEWDGTNWVEINRVMALA